MPYFEFLIGSVTQHFTNLMIVAERNEQAIKIGKIKGPIMNSKVMIKHELGNDSQIRNLVWLDLTISSGAHTPLSKINIPLPLKDIYQHFLNTRHVTLAPLDPIKPSFSRWYNPNEKWISWWDPRPFNQKLQEFQISSSEVSEQRISWVCEGMSSTTLSLDHHECNNINTYETQCC